MTPEELDEARAEEAIRLTKVDGFFSTSEAVKHAARLAREGWTPPDPPISPRVLAAREYTKSIQGSAVADAIDAGLWDDKFDVRAFLAGVAWAVKLAAVLVDAIEMPQWSDDLIATEARDKALQTYRQSIGEGE